MFPEINYSRSLFEPTSSSGQSFKATDSVSEVVLLQFYTAALFMERTLSNTALRVQNGSESTDCTSEIWAWGCVGLCDIWDEPHSQT